MALHAPLLHLPYFWDEAGYYVPAARDLLLGGNLIPLSTPSNAHPPLVLAYLALCWKVAGYAPVVTRTAMLLAASFSLLGLFRLAETAANTEVAIATTLCTALYPVFFAQSSLAHLDLLAAGLTFWGLRAYLKDRAGETALWFSLAALAKETAILAPLALLAWEILSRWLRTGYKKEVQIFPVRRQNFFWLLVPISAAHRLVRATTIGAAVLFSAIRSSFATTSRPRFIPCGSCWLCLCGCGRSWAISICCC